MGKLFLQALFIFFCIQKKNEPHKDYNTWKTSDVLLSSVWRKDAPAESFSPQNNNSVDDVQLLVMMMMRTFQLKRRLRGNPKEG
jgi:hypothetical protein